MIEIDDHGFNGGEAGDGAADLSDDIDEVSGVEYSTADEVSGDEVSGDEYSTADEVSGDEVSGDEVSGDEVSGDGDELAELGDDLATTIETGATPITAPRRTAWNKQELRSVVKGVFIHGDKAPSMVYTLFKGIFDINGRNRKDIAAAWGRIKDTPWVVAMKARLALEPESALVPEVSGDEDDMPVSQLLVLPRSVKPRFRYGQRAQKWQPEECWKLVELVQRHGSDWRYIGTRLGVVDNVALKDKFNNLTRGYGIPDGVNDPDNLIRLAISASIGMGDRRDSGRRSRRSSRLLKITEEAGSLREIRSRGVRVRGVRKLPIIPERNKSDPDHKFEASRFHGVTWLEDNGMFRARLHQKRKKHLDKLFTDAESAARAYDDACVLVGMERRNFPPPPILKPRETSDKVSPPTKKSRTRPASTSGRYVYEQVTPTNVKLNARQQQEVDAAHPENRAMLIEAMSLQNRPLSTGAHDGHARTFQQKWHGGSNSFCTSAWNGDIDPMNPTDAQVIAFIQWMAKSTNNSATTIRQNMLDVRRHWHFTNRSGQDFDEDDAANPFSSETIKEALSSVQRNIQINPEKAGKVIVSARPTYMFRVKTFAIAELRNIRYLKFDRQRAFQHLFNLRCSSAQLLDYTFGPRAIDIGKLVFDQHLYLGEGIEKNAERNRTVAWLYNGDKMNRPDLKLKGRSAANPDVRVLPPVGRWPVDLRDLLLGYKLAREKMCSEEIDVDADRFFALCPEDIRKLQKKDGESTQMTNWIRHVTRVIPDGYTHGPNENLTSRSLRKGMASAYDFLHGKEHREDLNTFAGWGRDKKSDTRTAERHYISHETWDADKEMDAAVYFFAGHARPTWSSYKFCKKLK